MNILVVGPNGLEQTRRDTFTARKTRSKPPEETLVHTADARGAFGFARSGFGAGGGGHARGYIRDRVAVAPAVSIGQPTVSGDLVKVMAWYDNEMGYSQRLFDLARFVAEKL